MNEFVNDHPLIFAVICLAVAIFNTVCTFFKPSFYWESRKAKRMRNLVGDIGTQIFYYGISGLFVYLAIQLIT